MKVEPNLSGGANASLATYFSARRIRRWAARFSNPSWSALALSQGGARPLGPDLTRPPPMAVRNYGASALSSIRPRTFCRANCVQAYARVSMQRPLTGFTTGWLTGGVMSSPPFRAAMATSLARLRADLSRAHHAPTWIS